MLVERIAKNKKNKKIFAQKQKDIVSLHFIFSSYFVKTYSNGTYSSVYIK